ncbi:hypothetical protein UFOVP626_3 [uncultured Caudovirales phage]|uniref:Uncharacterized protein n=1 Tax=uncultured Caudovirales phage TaxID=2100421 RepID=A0A6J5N8S9_9CAUD|nr:hypothetical protein UFOVP626_3 [uncultured Caudovirales phage]CAB4173395.1 hypothetical protein UFOVP951_58 [uncultured Caudovirales phage]CAB4184745.1 hypothetical protein UFOVP1115_33 [uncultured Caudovirales phage]CAB4203851.1 hypothetical protein UFOVP1390_9 [uncultured Caudovirales phage]CAB5238371.1 hypothetical protein UFOVP1567_32 [uncultured Caudovirales phage]
MPFIAVAGSLLGGYLQGESNKDAASISAAGQTEAARIAAAEARFRPIGITTRFGKSNFDYSIPGVSAPVAKDFATPEEFAAAQTAYQTRLGQEGRVTGAGYTLDPGLKAYQDRLLSLVNRGLLTAEQAEQQFAPLTTGAQGLFGLANQYLAESPEQAAAKYTLNQQNILAPGRERQLAGLRTNLFNTGRGGLSVGATGTRPGGGAGLGASTPELEAYYNAIAQQDAEIAAGAEQAGMARSGFGAGLLATGGNLLTQGYQGRASSLGPYQAYLSGATGLESLGQDPLNLGSSLGGRIANPEGGRSLLTGGMGAAATNFAANAYNPFAEALTSASRNPTLTNAANRFFSGGGGGGSSTGSGYSDPYANVRTSGYI